MTNSFFRQAFFLILIFTVASCTTAKLVTQPSADIKSLKYIGQYVIPFDLKFNNTSVGGLSGIDYDKKNEQYYLVCDDRSDKNPARFYTAKIFFTQKGIDSVVFTGVTYMFQDGGAVYPNSKQDPYRTPDPEAMRYNPYKKQLTWSSEGERIVTDKETVLQNPSINIIDMEGSFIDSFLLPSNLFMHDIEKGPRKNSVLEGMSFADDYQTLFVSVEEPLYEDGPRADVTENDAYIRIYKFDAKSKANIAQYAYRLSPIAYQANPETAFKINGVPDILSIGNNKLLVMERSYSTGRLPNTIRLFVADMTAATDITNTTLKENRNFTAASKKLLLNLDDLKMYTDNIEGMTFGPILPNGHKTLLLIADNNFNPLEQAQVLLFEVIE
jgi:hypothetical protein